MAVTTEDFTLHKNKRKHKYMVKTQVSYEMLPSLLNIPGAENVSLVDIYVDPCREIATFKFKSDVGLIHSVPGIRVFDLVEGQEIPNYAPQEAEIIEEMRKKVAAWDAKQIDKKGEK